MKKLFVLSLFFLSACTSTMHESGKQFVYKPTIVLDQTTKREVIAQYGQPTSTEIQGKYEIINYIYQKESLKHGRAIGMGALSAVPVLGFATLAMDQGVKDSDMEREYQQLYVLLELRTGAVKDYYYHDSELKGQDESESLYLQANRAKKEGKNDEYMLLLRKSVSLNSKNHLSLNSLAWTLIDLNIDLDEGIIFANQAVAVFPDSPYNNGTLGVGYAKKNDFENGEKYLSKAIELFPIYSPKDTKALQHDKAVLDPLRQANKS